MGQKAEYGVGHPNFIKYSQFIADHKVYHGMPDRYTDKGHIQWEAPSNRQAGKFKDTHRKRLVWWRRKAAEVGIDLDSNQWISKTAKYIHPTKNKPCKKCGRILSIRYMYPTKLLLNRISKLSYVDEDFQFEQFETITDLIQRLEEQYGKRIFHDLPELLKTKNISPPILGSELQIWLDWVKVQYIPSEPTMLSPGAMSNAPDRFDGFHSFNLCCRSQADKGRHTDNLRSYATDRRVFEYWNEGDWIAADRLVGIIRSTLRKIDCLYGHPGPCSVDHIGPLSLGFAHRPEFQFLCSSCNSSKNNRMTLRDIKHLIRIEEAGDVVTSWYNKDIWNMRKNDVTDEETALRLSKLLRDNRSTAMNILYSILEKGHYSFLSTLLYLDATDFDVRFINLRVEAHITRYDKIIHSRRVNKYSLQQKARRVRIAFDSLFDYHQKESRNAFIISNGVIEKELQTASSILERSPLETKRLDLQIGLLLSAPEETADTSSSNIAAAIPSDIPNIFREARARISNAMALVAIELSNMWQDERYMRTDIDAEL